MFITLLTFAITSLDSQLSDDDALLADDDDLSELFQALLSVELESTPRGVTGLTMWDIPAETSEYGEPVLASAVNPREIKQRKTREQIAVSLTTTRDNFPTLFIYLLSYKIPRL